jgi:hypothetical protein
MLVLLSPEFDGSELQVTQLAQLTGLLPYDLRARLRPGAWGVLRVLANMALAKELVAELQSLGLHAVAIDATVGQDPERRVVYLRGLSVTDDGMLLRLSEREMFVPYGALVSIVRGEVHLGRSQMMLSAVSGPSRPTAGSWSAASAGPESSAMGDGRNAGVTDVFAAADLHFATVQWVARIDARELEFPPDVPMNSNVAERLDILVDWIASRSNVRVDRQLHVSSLSSHTEGPRAATGRNHVAAPDLRRSTPPLSDAHFDAYSRLVAEAERVRWGQSR